MKILIFLISLLPVHFVTCFSVKRAPFFKRNSLTLPGEPLSNIECIHMQSFPGEYWYTSPGSTDVCGLFIIGHETQLVEIVFQDFKVGCEEGGLIATVDGWEVENQFFPGDDDHELSMDDRYKTYCGKNLPKRAIVMSQNVALIQFRLPTRGDRFKIQLSFLENPQPCNVLSMLDAGTHTLHNYGMRRNCSVSLLYPEHIQILNLDVGVTTEAPSQLRETGVLHQCLKRNKRDYVELLDGNGLDPGFMWREANICGLESKANSKLMSYSLGCQHSVLRLVSSGQYYNSVTFQYKPLDDLETATTPTDQC